MPKKKQDLPSGSEFYEFLASTADSLNLPWLKSNQHQRESHWFRDFRSQVMRFGALAIPVVTATYLDITRYFARLVTTAISKPARRIYMLAVALAMVGGVGAATMVASATYAVYSGDLASPTMLLAKKDTGTTILDKNGQVLYRVYGANNRKLVQLSQIPPSLVKATLAAEDPDFYRHPGFSWRGTTRAIYHDITHGGKLQGGSTITQQLVKNALLTHDKSFTRKYQEVLLAIELERRYSKDEILQMYLNEIYYGQGAHGVESASHTYFRKPDGTPKSTSDLTLGESALLAGLPLCPSACDPNVDIEAATGRRNFILGRMQELGLITPGERRAAQQEPMQTNARQVEINAPHFVFYVLDELRQKYGEDKVERGGITVYTTLDLEAQKAAERIVREQVAGIRRFSATNGALIGMKPSTGEIVSMVGSIDYQQPGFGNVNVTLAQRQPGSSFKPFAYITAFKKGWNGATTVDDLPLSLPGGDGTIYRPKNYDGTFRGPNITLRRALANSLNIPAVNVLRHAGIHDTIQTAKSMGITSLNDEHRYGLSLVLGGGEVRMLDMATAYSTMANMGTKVPPKSITKVLDRYNKDITLPDPNQPQPVLDPRLAYMMTHILGDNQARTEMFGANSPLNLAPHISFAKTGTTNDYRDNWAAGGTADLVAVAWVGNNDNSPMSNVDGITGAAPIWNRYLKSTLGTMPPKPFPKPAGLTTARVCLRDGGLANPWDSSVEEVFLNENVPTRKCNSQRPKSPEELKDEAAKKAEDELRKQLERLKDDATNGVGGPTDLTPEPEPDEEDEEDLPAPEPRKPRP